MSLCMCLVPFLYIYPYVYVFTYIYIYCLLAVVTPLGQHRQLVTLHPSQANDKSTTDN